jgi:hypothetical protein
MRKLREFANVFLAGFLICSVPYAKAGSALRDFDVLLLLLGYLSGGAALYAWSRMKDKNGVKTTGG